MESLLDDWKTLWLPKMGKLNRGRRVGAMHSFSNEAWAEAVRREAIIRPLVAEGRLTRVKVATAAATLGLRRSRLYELVEAFRQNPVTTSLAPSPSGPSKGSRRLHALIEARISRAIEAVYLTAEKPTLKEVFRQVRQDCLAERQQPPSIKALRARVTARSLRERVAAREGAGKAGDRFRQVKPAPKTTRPLEVVQIDHTQVDLMLVDERKRAAIGRPWLTVVLDMQTRLVLGFYLTFEAPSATSVALAVANAIAPKNAWLADMGISLAWPAQGLPEVVRVDNGSDFHSRAFARGCQQHGITIDYRPPATPRFGGHIERLMGTLMKRIHVLPGTTFSNVAERGTYPSDEKATLTFREFERYLAFEVLGPYHNDIHSALGRSPLAVWSECAAQSELRLPSDLDSLLFDFLPFEERMVTRQGVRLFNIFYQDGALAHLVEAGGVKARVKYDPRDISTVFVELPGGDHVRVPYADLRYPPVTLWEHRNACRILRLEGRRLIDEHAIFEAIAGQRQILDEARKLTKAERRRAARSDLAAAVKGRGSYDADANAERPTGDPDAKVPMPPDGSSGVEFW